MAEDKKFDGETDPGLLRSLETPPSNYDVLAGGRSSATPTPMPPEAFEPTVSMEAPNPGAIPQLPSAPPPLPHFSDAAPDSPTQTSVSPTVTSVSPTRPITRTAPAPSELHESPTVFGAPASGPPPISSPLNFAPFPAQGLEDAPTAQQLPPSALISGADTVVDDEGSTVQKTDAELAQIQQLLAGDPTKFDTLPGEAPEVPTPPPYSLRPAGSEGGTSQVDSGQTAHIRMRRSMLGWSAGGLLTGLGLFLGVYFFPPFETVTPFATVKFTIIRENIELPLPLPNRWAGHADALIGSSPESVVVVPLDAEIAAGPLSVQTNATIDPKLVGMITEPLFEGVAIAWPGEDGVRWTQARAIKNDSGKSEGNETEIQDSRNELRGELPLRSDERIVWAPIKIEDAAAAGPEPFVMVARGPERDTILKVDPETQKRVSLISPARLVANLVPFQPDGDLPAALLYITAEGAGTLPANAEEFAPPTAKFAQAWPEEDPVAVERVRLGPGRRGWIIARQGAMAALELNADGSVTLLAEEALQGGSKDGRLAPHVFTFPDGDRPGADRALIALDQSKGILVSFENATGPGSKLTSKSVTLPGGEITTFDLNGDGLFDFVGLDTDGTLSVIHGQKLELAGERVKTNAPLPASPIRWRATPEGPEAHYLTADGQAVTIQVHPQWVLTNELAEAMRKDRRWREGQSPL